MMNSPLDFTKLTDAFGACLSDGLIRCDSAFDPDCRNEVLTVGEACAECVRGAQLEADEEAASFWAGCVGKCAACGGLVWLDGQGGSACESCHRTSDITQEAPIV